MPSEWSVHAVQKGPTKAAICDGERTPGVFEVQTCPVWAIPKAGTPITSSYEVVAGQGER